MKRRIDWKATDFIALGLVLLSVLTLVYATFVAGVPGDSQQAASRLERRIEKRMNTLDSLFDAALAQDPEEWLDLGNVPQDIVIYRYVDNNLQSWVNSLIVTNEDISGRLLFQRLANPRNAVSSPFVSVTEEVSYLNLGTQWFLLKTVTDGGSVKLVGGLEILDENDHRIANNTNPKLGINAKFSIHPLSFSGGSPVMVDGRPQFKIMCESMRNPSAANVYIVWLALGLFILAVLVFFSGRRSLRCFYVSISLITLALSWIYFWGNANQDLAPIFSPTVFADGPLLYSLASVLILNAEVLLLAFCAYMVRNRLLWCTMHASRPKAASFLLAAAAALAIAGICCYTHVTFSSIVRNSNINLELYKLNDLSWYSLIVYVSYLTMLLSLPLMMNFMRPWIWMMTGHKTETYSVINRTSISVLAALYFVVAAAVLGFKKEDDRMDVWASRLSMDRDIEVELRLRLMENSIANDSFIATLSVLPNASDIVQNRLIDNYMFSIAQDYDVTAVIFDADERDPMRLNWFNDRVRGGTKVSNMSRWVYSSTVSGHQRYTALFTYFSPEYGVSYLVVEVEPKASRDYSAYADILGMSANNKVTIPARYSHARYNDGKLVMFNGSFAYPTVLTEELKEHLRDRGEAPFISDGHVHFPRKIDDGEYMVLTRKQQAKSNYLVALVFLALMSYILQSFLALGRRRKSVFESSYFRMRITWVLMVSLISTLVVLTAVSVVFVYERNKANRLEMMSDKINTLQSVMSTVCRHVSFYTDINPQELSAHMESAAEMSKSDITLYNPYGKAFRSTAVDVFDRMLVSDRMDGDAFNEIKFNHKRFVIQKEKVRGKRYTMLYAPLFNEAGNVIAILSSPYSDDNYDFQNEAVMHSVSILAVFFILLLLARFMVTSIVDRLFQPLVTLGSKMNRTDVENLEKIEYDRNDEVSTLVHAYNMMVEDLADSTQKLAQAERDKAWNSMARQVAHEIKNPLTPMKLQLQRLIRLKQRNAPGWEDKFDDVAKVVLDHIDILSDTANEFSTFAKLESETPALLDLDVLIQEEISMFDNKENVRFTYIGMPEAMVMAPKPQLTRVIVNLLTNSVQAIEIQQQDDVEAGKEMKQGSVVISLRNSMKDGYYDIVIEDNGPGVKPENQEKLFTPNFTTKSSGTGLGLAICRSILEKCGASISYSKSFSLNGACFTIIYPKSTGKV